jgi:hypothetical protein
VEQIRILLVGVPPLLGDILRRAGETDVRVVGEWTAASGVAGAVDERDANVVVVGAPDRALPHVASALFDRHPRLLVIAITLDGRRATLHMLRPHSQRLGDVSAGGLAAAIRAAATVQATAW